MNLAPSASRGWDARIAFPLQSVGYAHAACALGHRPYFAEDERGIALVLVRRVPVPVLGAWTARAKVYAHARDAAFLPALVDRLRTLGVSHVKLGDAMWGVSGALPEAWRPLQRVDYHVFVNDLRLGADELLARVRGALRRDIRKAAAAVTVTEVRTARDLRDYRDLAGQTGQRMRSHDLAAVYPASYFETILREMVPRRQAALLLARAGETPLAGGLFMTSGDRFVYLHGCSTRDRALTPKQGPTAVFWHAMRFARARGYTVFDMGAVTPTADRTHPHSSVYEYKKGWGGRLEAVPSGELIVSSSKYRFQEFVLAPMWDRLHPLYLRLFGGRTPADTALDWPTPEPGTPVVATTSSLSAMAGQERL
jgi:GNAT acetyltransferase-like protein